MRISLTSRVYQVWGQGLALTALALGLGACGQSPQEPFSIDGSSTVYPISKAVLEQYQQSAPKAPPIQINFSGTTGGFRQFCEGKTQISNASRPINREEINLCNQNEVRFLELPIAFDALTVVVNPQNSAVNSLTVAELKTMWEPGAQGKVMKWNQVNPAFPDQPLRLVGPGGDSGTFDYFTEAIAGKAGASRMDYLQTEDDGITVQVVEQNPNALGYFGLAYYEQNAKQLKAVPIDNGAGPVAPTKENVEKATYQPLSRPLFIYVNLAAAQNNGNLRDFVEFYLKSAPETVAKVGYVPLPEDGYHLAEVTLQNGEAGTVFDGQSQIGLTIGELLRKKAKF
ncbi:MAG: PstS family phosphate ABC transporter substrate-binding protein [Cyanobacteriota bacterium]|nr:PstS family phosphate ABC transporter substrate-binding protein [Cyanobacteriota bacterium]